MAGPKHTKAKRPESDIFLCQAQDERRSKADSLGTPPAVTVHIRGPIKGYIKPYYNYYPTVTEGVQYPTDSGPAG